MAIGYSHALRQRDVSCQYTVTQLRYVFLNADFQFNQGLKPFS